MFKKIDVSHVHPRLSFFFLLNKLRQYVTSNTWHVHIWKMKLIDLLQFVVRFGLSNHIMAQEFMTINLIRYL